MRGDFSRFTFDKARRFSRVLFQQGRDLIDADANELSTIHWQQLRDLADTAVGWYGRRSAKFWPADNKLTVPPDSPGELLLHIEGFYYIGGFCVRFAPPLERTVPRPLQGKYLLLFLDVYEETVYPATDPNLPDPTADPKAPGPPPDPRALVREPALDPRDTALRVRPAWVVQAALIDDLPKAWDSAAAFRQYLAGLANYPYGRARPGTGMLQAQVRLDTNGTASRCDPVTANQYQGIENQLYRVEIHDPVLFEDVSKRTVKRPPTFKWSRDNASVVFAVADYVADQQTLTVRLSQPALDEAWAVQRGNWVEMVAARPPQPVEDQDPFLAPLPLLLVTDVDPDQKTVTLALPDGFPVKKPTREDYPLLLRWDHTLNTTDTGGIAVQLKTDDKHPAWLPLEAGVQVQFTAGGKDLTCFRPGDYWLIPTRVANQGVIWPNDPKDLNDPKQPAALPPDGPEHLYAPLAILSGSEKNPGTNPPLTIHSYPDWSQIDTPVQPSAGWNIDRIILNAATSANDEADPTTSADTTGLALLNRLQEPSAQAVTTYSLRQMLVIAGSDPTAQPPAWKTLLEQLRRFQLGQTTTLATLIHNAVNKLLTPNTVVNILKPLFATNPTPGPGVVENVIDLQSVVLTVPDGSHPPLDATIVHQSLEKNPLANTVPVIAGMTSDALSQKVANDIPSLSQAQKDMVTALWKSAVLIDHYFKAWPYRTIQLTDDKKDWQ
jgi:hypothetical protein